MSERVPAHLEKVAQKMAKVGRTEYKMFRRPCWKEYTLVRYEDGQVVERKRVWINESEVFPLAEDFFWEPKNMEKAA